MTARVFAGIFPPADVVEELEELVGPRREVDHRVRWVFPEHWHLTTVFVGSCPDSEVEDLVEGLTASAVRTPAFDVRVAGGGAFPDPLSVRAFYLGVTGGQDQLAHLSKTMRAAASHAGVPPDGTRFVPHLTMARTRTRFEGTQWLRVLESFGAFEWSADRVTIVQSHLGQGASRRSRYEVLGEIPLVRRPAVTRQ